MNFLENVFGTLLFIIALISAGGWLYLLVIAGHPTITEFIQSLQIFLTLLTAAAAALFAQKTARNQRESAIALEQLRARLAQVGAREHEAYHTMWKAINRYYRALKDFLEVGDYNEKDVEDAVNSCKEAEDTSLLIEPLLVDEFYSYWQHATFIAETARENTIYPDTIKDLWRAENEEFTRKYFQLKEKLSNKVRSLFSGS